jgi:NAD(P)H dehydrogenase (quinone)
VPEIAALASEVLGKPIEVVEVDDAAYAGGLAHAGLPATIIPMLASFEINTRQGGMDIRTEAVEILTGHKPQALRDFLGANKAALLA